jgi:hypothetical protein
MYSPYWIIVMISGHYLAQQVLHASEGGNYEMGEEIDETPRETTSGIDEATRKLIGQAIIDGLLVPSEGAMTAKSKYTQTFGNYWQGPGGEHSQHTGDYHQGVKTQV